MNIKIIFLILIAITFKTNAQMNSVFSLTENNETDIDVYFYQNGTFQIIMQEAVTDDLIYEFTISGGKYSIKNDQIVCSDWFNGFESKFNYKVDSITLKESFNFIKNKTFLKSKFQNYESPDLYRTGVENSQELREKYKKNLLNNCDFHFGIFKNNRGFKLDLSKDNSYRLVYKDIIISKGKWFNGNNELTLNDMDLGHSFYVIKGKYELINLMFPWNNKLLTYKIITP